MYVFITGMERCGTHSTANIIRAAFKNAHVTHEDQPTLCKEAKLFFEQKEYRTHELKQKIHKLRKYHKKHPLVCEANHRLSFFIRLLVREFNCKIIFLARDPVQTIISRISTWAFYKNHAHLYPEFFLKKEIPEEKKEFNEYRLSPPESDNLNDLYLWEWLQTYKNARTQLGAVPHKDRLLFFCEDLTNKFDHLLGFIDKFEADDEVMGWARTKSDSVYIQKKEKETDIFITQNRDPKTDETVIFAQNIINREKISSTIIRELKNLSHIDDGINEMDRRIISLLQPKMI